MITVDAHAKLSPDLLAIMSSGEFDEDTRMRVVARCSPDRTDVVAEAVDSRGGTLLRRIRAIGVVSFEAPIGRIRDLASIPDVQSMTLDETLIVR